MHSFRYIETSSSHIPNLTDYFVVIQLNDVQMACYDGKDTIRFSEEWMNLVFKEAPEKLENEKQLLLFFKIRSQILFNEVLQDLNQTQGAHIWQVMAGCDWDDETEEKSATLQLCLDGEHFSSLDRNLEKWIALTPWAQIITDHWNRVRDNTNEPFWKKFLSHDCGDKLKKYLPYGQHTLRTELPLVSLLQKSSSGPVTCHATRFYPDRAMLFWTKDGVEVTEDVDPGEILPNGDGTFQTSVSLDLSSVPPEDWDKFNCVFQLSGVQDDYVTRLDRTKIITNTKKTPASMIVAVVTVGVAVIIASVVFVIRRKRAQNKRQQDAQMQQNLNPVVQATNTSPDPETQTLNPEAPESTESHRVTP
ncbi:major histocompatibility complex class I-related gene protein-like, partial [Boleophthalmus pectinirostris]|uniref:major histocompatibility complex class I-related gene protein-like n=1 Tax=Boleophthalmus pectinirostris TaxID=150288 RepID=UPI00242E3260